MYYVGFSTATIVASVILFQGFNTDDPANSISLLAGFITTFLGVHLLEISRKPEALPTAANGHGHSALEGGIMNPRLSLQGRVSIDGWGAPSGAPIANTPHSARHGRQNSAALRSATLFDAYEEEDEITDNVGLARLPEAVEDDDDDELEHANERTHLRYHQDERRHGSRSPGSLSRGASPR